MATTVDTQTFDLGNGETASGTLTWNTATDDKGDWTVTAVQTADLADSTDVRLVEIHERTVTAVSPGGAASVSRTLDGSRTSVATGAGVGTSSRTVDAIRELTGSGAGVGVASRVVDGTRTTIAVGSPGEGSAGFGEVSRDAIYYRSTWAASRRGAVSTTWTAPRAWAVETEDGETVVLLEPLSTSTDHDSISLDAAVPAAKKEALEYLERAGSVAREDTAFGAFRRISRGDVDSITVKPPAKMDPPFTERTVHATGYGADEVAPDWWEISLDFGLDRPRARDPPTTSSEPTVVDETTVHVDAESTETATLRWTPSGSDLGEYLATASIEETYAHPSTSDSTAVTVSESPWALDFGVAGASMNLTERNILRVGRSSSSGVPSITVPLRVDGELASVVFAAGSRADASQIRNIPDAGNVPVDPLPDSDLTVSLSAPADAEVESGTYILESWSAAREENIEEPYEVDLTLLEDDV